jgi:hypothetical protein
VGSWYWIGVCAGLGAAVGVLGVALLRDARLGVIAGAAGAALGALGSIPTVRGALARGGTRAGTALLVGVVAVVLAALSFVPVLGYVIALALPVLGVRLRRRQSERHAGLRILARD